MNSDTDTPTAECPQCLNHGGCPYCLGNDPDCQSCLGKNLCPECLSPPAPGSPADMSGATGADDSAGARMEKALPDFYTKLMPPVRTVGELLHNLRQLPPELILQCRGQDFVQVSVCKNGELYIVLVEESRGPDAEPGAAPGRSSGVMSS